MRKAREQFQWWMPALAAGVLAGMAAWQHTLPDESVGRPYRDSIISRFKDYPLTVNDPVEGPWEGRETSIPKEAVALLGLNFYVCRSYYNPKNGWSADVLIEETSESRNMMGHYPPNCYPGAGWMLVSSAAAKNRVDDKPEWVVGDLRFKGTEYQFKQEGTQAEIREWVRNFFLLPNGTTYADIATFGRAASDFAIRPYGAAQVQVILRQEYLPDDRERIFQSLMRAHMDLIGAMRKKD